LATCAYILIFILANGLLTALSIEHQLQFTVSDGAWDTDYLLYPEAPVVIAVCNLAGTAAIVGFAWPALKAVLRRRPEDDEDRLEANSWVGVRCLTIGAFAGVVVLVLWAVAGIALPAWNSWGGGASHVTWVGGVRFFIHHMVFATIAAPVTFVAVTLAIVHELFPPLIPFVGTPAARRAIPKVENLLTGSTTMLALTPYFGLLVLGLTNAVDSRFGLVVAAVGIGGAAFAHLAAPVIRSRLRLIDRALTPLEESMFSRK
jgi:hypothetical protein